ncbi:MULTISPECIES: hypothetical protein [Streptomyces]|uniref:hypothetical protein n=1 Tax=Streptomyces TaxID=1883 RepID=UPI0022487AEF|nr:hypothetical protein [Streptomyces sp. JHD 1]MCX2968685.1 hypothetical protein [Streptomyces sp. JHD 1]
MTPEPLLLVADHVTGGIEVFAVPGGTRVARLPGPRVSEHAGFLALPGGRVACVDEAAGELLVLDPSAALAGGPLVAATAPVAVPGEHLAADATGERIAVTTGVGERAEPWSDLVTAVDLRAGAATAVRARTGEPGVTVVGAGAAALVLLRQREPGELALYRHAGLLAAGPGHPRAVPLARLPLPDDGHGDAHDPATGLVFAATGEGVYRARVRGTALLPEPPLPWRGAGRGYFLRLDPGRRLLWSCLRGGPGDPARWPEWTNTAWCHGLDSGRTALVDLGPGLVFRMALARGAAAFTRVHPDGDELLLLDPARPRVAARTPLEPMSGAPRRGGTPWDGVQRRAVAASPGADWVAVSRGGHGEVLIVDARTGRPGTVLRTRTPLPEGGRLAMVSAGDRGHEDAVGR